MNKTDLTPEKVSKMINEFFIENKLSFSTTRTKDYNKNLNWLQDRKIPTYSTIYDKKIWNGLIV